jgi:hypothetical protein
MAGKQAVVIHLPSWLVRSTKELIGDGRPYSDISELAELSIQNQLLLDSGGTALSDDQPQEIAGAGSQLLLGLPDEPPGNFSEDRTDRQEALSSFTNRLLPIKIACRVLANSPADTSLADFQRNAANAAREVGRALRDQDQHAGVKGMGRRWVALPIGEKGPSTLNRFINHFTVTQRRDGPPDGPLTRLGLAGVHASGRPRLTLLGWELGSALSPVLDNTETQEGATLGRSEREILIRAIDSNSAERENLAEFREIVNSAAGRQGSIDRKLRSGRDLNSDEAAAYRAGTIGRLHDLSLASVSGTGEGAHVTLVDAWPWSESEGQ